MEVQVSELMKAGITVDLLTGYTEEGIILCGVRLRTIGKRLPKQLMILASAEYFVEALDAAITKAEDGRWESLDWRARPWEVRDPSHFNPYGLPVDV